MGGAAEFPTSPTQFVYGVNYEKEKIEFRFLVPTDLIHSCTETHTYILKDQPTMFGISHELNYDLYELHNTPLPYGQIVILSYFGNGEFLIEAATERFKPHLVEKSFQSFGYADVQLRSNAVFVSEKDTFKLKLKYGS